MSPRLFVDKELLSRNTVVLIVVVALTSVWMSYAPSVVLWLIVLSASYAVLVIQRNHMRIKKELLEQQRIAEAKSLAQVSLLSNIINTTVDGLITFNESGIIEMYNLACERLFRYTEAEAIGRNVSVLMPELCVEQGDNTFAHILRAREKTTNNAPHPLEGVRNDGTTFPLELSVSEVVQDGKRIFCGLIRDISERVQSEQKILQYAAQVQSKSLDMASAKEQAETATRIKSDFIANISHEIRSHISGIIGMSNLLMDAKLATREFGYAETVKQSAESLLQIINDVLDLSKVESGRIELDHIAFDLKLLCEEIFTIVHFKAGEKHIELLLRYPENVPCRVMGDPARIRQILLNLLNNAIKFTERGYVLLSVNCTPPTEGYVVFHIEVEDTGIGIAPESVDYVFDTFNRVDASPQRRLSGGLGLSLCRELTRVMGGKIGVKSELGKGSTFWLGVTLKEDEGDAETFSAPREALLNGLRILVVDDNEMARIILQEQLTPYGVTLHMANSGEQALLMIAGDDRFDIAIIDLVLPGMDGMQLGRALKERRYVDKITAMLMLTSTPSRGDIQQMEDIGFVGYLNKSVAQEKLREALCIIADARRKGRKIPVITQHNMAEAKEERQRMVNKNLQFIHARILLVDDNPVSQAVAVAMLERYGCHVTVASNGDEALQRLSERSFDLAFMDCQMPVMDGFEATMLIRKLEEHQARKRLPVIALTADSTRGMDRQCIEGGMNGYITKPLRQSELERMLVDWIPQEKHVIKECENEDGASVLDIKVFEGFRDLMEESAAAILTRYIDTSQHQIGAMADALRKEDFVRLQDIAYRLDVASRQMGAAKLSLLASDMGAAAARAEKGDKEKLRVLMEQLTPLYSATKRVIERKMQKEFVATPQAQPISAAG